MSDCEHEIVVTAKFCVDCGKVVGFSKTSISLGECKVVKQ